MNAGHSKAHQGFALAIPQSCKPRQKVVEAKPLLEYFRRADKIPGDFRQIPFYFVRRHLFNPVTLNIGLLVILLPGSLLHRFFFVLLLTHSTFLIWLYFHAHTIAHGLSVRRRFEADTLVEFKETTVSLDFYNASPYDVTSVLIEDHFGPTLSKDIILSPPQHLAARSMRTLSYTRPCDGGMGRHIVGPITIRVTDPLGIFEFRVCEPNIEEVLVRPHIEPLPELPVRGTADSNRYGNYETAARGLSVNFTGVRPYTFGDSLRHIAWKISTKGRGLFVKEFEKCVNAEVVVFLNLERRVLTGHKSNSTWEYGKDAALAIVSQQLELGNSVAFFSNSARLESGMGRDHFAKLCRLISSMEPLEEGTSFEPSKLLVEHIRFVSKGSVIFYVVPFHDFEHAASFPILQKLRAYGHQVLCVYIDTNTFWPNLTTPHFDGISALAPTTGLEKAIDRLKLSGIEVYRVQNRADLHDGFSPKVKL